MTSQDLELKTARAILQSYLNFDGMSDEEWEAYDDKEFFLKMARAAIDVVRAADATMSEGEARDPG
jgi:hypothetical protein